MSSPLQGGGTLPPPQPIHPSHAVLSDLLAWVKQVASGLPEATGVLGTVETVLRAVLPMLDPAAGREAQREAILSAFYRAQDRAGLWGFRDDKPPHPNHSLDLEAWYDQLLVAAGVPAPSPWPPPAA